MLCADLGSEVKTQRSKVNLILSVRVSENKDTAAIFIDVSFRRAAVVCFSLSESVLFFYFQLSSRRSTDGVITADKTSDSSVCVSHIYST